MLKQIVASAGIAVAIASPALAMQTAVVVATIESCDYFIADWRTGLYVLDWRDGYYPDEGDRVSGELSGEGVAEVYYPGRDEEGELRIENFLKSREGALDNVAHHC